MPKRCPTFRYTKIYWKDPPLEPDRHEIFAKPREVLDLRPTFESLIPEPPAIATLEQILPASRGQHLLVNAINLLIDLSKIPNN